MSAFFISKTFIRIKTIKTKDKYDQRKILRFQSTHVSLNLFYFSFSADYFSQLTFCKTLQKKKIKTQKIPNLKQQSNQFNKWYSFCLSVCFFFRVWFSFLLHIFSHFIIMMEHKQCLRSIRRDTYDVIESHQIHTQNRFKKTIFSIRSQYQFIDKKL